MRLTLIGLILSLAIISSCSKKDAQPSNAIVGQWIFTNQATISYAYSSMSNYSSFPIGTTNYSISLDSINITFDNNGKYIFRNFHLPVENGDYTIEQDSLLVIKPDTADFVKFNYVQPSLIAVVDTIPGTLPAPVYAPYTNFHYTSDTILFRKTATNAIVFSGIWLTKASQPLIPSNDTLLLNQSFNYFKRK